MIVAVAGRRDLEHWETDYLISCGEYLRQAHHTMTNGGADGADRAFATGFTTSPGDSPLELYLPWRSFRPATGREECRYLYTSDQALPEHRELAERAHPFWGRLRPAVRSLMIRNAMLIRRFDRPADKLWAYPDRSRPGFGGTGHAMRVSRLLGIEVILLPEGKPWRD